MFHIHDTVFYPSGGVCVIDDIRVVPFEGLPDRNYYILHPIDHPQETIFVPVDSDRVRLRHLIGREEAVRLMKLSEDQENDILHYIELHTDLPAAKGYRIYRKLAEVLRARRAYKAESELLEPMYQFVLSQSAICDQLSQVQGRTRGTREAIERRQYICRTDILDDMPE